MNTRMRSMIGDTPVISITDEEMENKVFIFYDFDINAFILRGKRDLSKQLAMDEFQKKITYSYVCHTLYCVNNMLNFLFPYKGDNKRTIEIALLNYPDLPNETEDITFSLLSSAHDIENFCYNDFQEDYDIKTTFVYCDISKKYYTMKNKRQHDKMYYDISNLLDFIQHSHGMYESYEQAIQTEFYVNEDVSVWENDVDSY